MTGSEEYPASDFHALQARKSKTPLIYGASVSLAALALGLYATRIEPDWLQVEGTTLRLRRLAAAFNGYRLLHISDIHFGQWMTAGRLRRIVEHINAQCPDLVVITGDFASPGQVDRLSEMVKPLRRLRSCDGVLAVLGNHDHWTDAAKVRHALQAAAVIEVRNTIHSIGRNGTSLHVAGLDDVWARQRDLPRVLRELPADGCAILLSHEPDIASTVARTHRFDLQLSGHTHGGQVRFPWLRPPRLPLYGRKYYSGLYQIGGLTISVNRGLGMSRPFMRLNCRPQISLFELRNDVA